MTPLFHTSSPNIHLYVTSTSCPVAALTPKPDPHYRQPNIQRHFSRTIRVGQGITGHNAAATPDELAVKIPYYTLRKGEKGYMLHLCCTVALLMDEGLELNVDGRHHSPSPSALATWPVRT